MNAVASRNIRLIGHSDQGGRPDGIQIMVHRGHAYIGHAFSNGISVIDVRDPANPKPVDFIPCPPHTRCNHLQAHDDLLLAINSPSVQASMAGTQAQATTGLRVYDLSQPERPREIGFMPTDGTGPHRIWYVGGRYAYVSIHYSEFTDHVLAIVDLSDPAKPQLAGKWWLPGMWKKGGETSSSPKGKRFALHHAIVANNIAYGAWRDGGMTILDVSTPDQPKLLAHRNWDPPFGGGTHTTLPLPDRNLLVVADETASLDPGQEPRRIWLFDVRMPTNPVSIATMPLPDDRDYAAKGGLFGPHNLHENRPGSWQDSRYLFATYGSAGVRVYDIENPFRPLEVGFYVPANPQKLIDPRPNRPLVIQSNDCFVDVNGMMYVTDANAGLHILQIEGT